MQTIDLSKCKKGDILISSHGAVLEYVAPTPYKDITFLDHVVKYITDEDGNNIYDDERYSTRTNDGLVLLGANYIVKIIHLADKPENFSENDPESPYWLLAEDIRKKEEIFKVTVEKEQYNESFHKAVEYVQEHYCDIHLKTPYMLLDDVAELIKITTGKEIDVNVLAKYSNK